MKPWIVAALALVGCRSSPPVESREPIEGAITAVEQEDDRTLAHIDRGSLHGRTQGTRLQVIDPRYGHVAGLVFAAVGRDPEALRRA